MTIEHINESDKGYFKVIENDREIGRMTYYWRTENTFVIDHTFVNPAYEGRGIGKKLLMASVDFARANDFKIVPLCSFVVALFDRIEAIQDVKG